MPAYPPVLAHIGGVPISELVHRFGTPTYVYDAETIRHRITELRAFDVIRYAQKACSNLAVLDLMRRQGVLVDAVSAGEIFRALRAGYLPQGDPPPIVFTADVFDEASLEMVLRHDIEVNVGSPDMIDQLGDRAPGRNLTLRINPGFGHGHSRKTNTGGEHSKHGIWHEQLDECLLRADRHGMGVTGAHMHIGSGTDLEHLAQVCGAMEQYVLRIGRSITAVSAGGGLPVPYRDQDMPLDVGRYWALWDAARRRIEERLGHAVRLEVEPGRYLVAQSGYLIAQIRAVKSMGSNLFYLLDAGFNHLARPILYGAYHPMAIAYASGRTDPASLQEVVVGGPLCESGDIFTQEEGGLVCRRPLPRAKVGDFLVVQVAGAYGFVMASNYNSHPLPAEVFIDQQQAHLVRRRQSLEELLQGESIPGGG
jgi:diaminopimelate decarboxylase